MSRRATPEAFDARQSVLLQDEALLVIQKPAGWEVLDEPSSPAGTPALLPVLRRELSLPDLYPAHRLDRDTTGCLAFGVTAEARERLDQAFASREACKRYLALCVSAPSPSAGAVDVPLMGWRPGRRPVRPARRQRGGGNRGRAASSRQGQQGKRAHTGYRTLHDAADGALLLCAPRTGRTHQIRVHLEWLGCPLYGDDAYGDRARNRDLRRTCGLDRAALHAWRLALPHPSGGGRSVEVEAAVPDDMARAIESVLNVDAASLAALLESAGTDVAGEAC